MAKYFYSRLKNYFEQVGEVLRGEADADSIFPTSIGTGLSREMVYVEFLKQHAPPECNVLLDGFLFGENGNESSQFDMIISTDAARRYDFHNPDGKSKSFGPVEGCLGVASIKSKLNKTQLFDSLTRIASIPKTKPLGQRVNPMLKIEDYDDWPFKIIYASDGMTDTKILEYMDEFYSENSNIPICRRPDIIHIAGKYVMFRFKEGMSISVDNGTTEMAEVGKFISFTTNSDMQAMIWTLGDLQKKATASFHISLDYGDMIDKISEL